jgi:hypothetical protein
VNEPPQSGGGPAEAAFGIFFFLVWGAFMLAAFGGMALALGALVSAARLPAEAFGPWWDNTKTIWLVGIAVGFLLPCGSVVSGAYWFFSGHQSYRRTGLVSRPFWSGPPKPPPPVYYPPPPPAAR